LPFSKLNGWYSWQKTVLKKSNNGMINNRLINT